MQIAVQTGDRCALLCNTAAAHFNEEWTHAVDICQNREEETRANGRLTVPPAGSGSHFNYVKQFIISLSDLSRCGPTTRVAVSCSAHSLSTCLCWFIQARHGSYLWFLLQAHRLPSNVTPAAVTAKLLCLFSFHCIPFFTHYLSALFLGFMPLSTLRNSMLLFQYFNNQNIYWVLC